MLKTMPSLDEILEKNPHIDRDDLNANTSLSEALQKQGVQKKGYDLAPTGSRMIDPSETTKGDPRTVRLSKN